MSDHRADSEELAILSNSAAGFVAKHCDHKRTRALRHTAPGYDQDIARGMAELGWFGVLVPAEFSGIGLGFAEFAAVLQAAGRGLMAEPLVAGAVLAGRALQHTGHAALEKRLLPPLARGERLFALAWQEQWGGIDLSRIQTCAASDARTTTLTGRKRFVAGAHAASGFLVTASSSDGLALYWVEPDAAGFELGTEWRSDGTPIGVLSLMDTPAERIAGSRTAEAALEQAFDEAITMVAAELLGVMTEVLDRTIDYLKTRVQFDKPIGSFQALQHRAVDLYILLEVSRSVVEEAVQAMDDNAVLARERSRIASRVKARLSSAALKVTRAAVQLHGAIGFTDDCDIGLFLNRALTLSAWLGNAAVHRQRYGMMSGNA